MYELCFCYFVLLFSMTALPIVGAARWARTSSRWMSRTRCFPQAILTCFGFFFLRLVALFCFSLGWWGSPCRVFPPPCLLAFLLSGLVGSPCRVFPVFSPWFLGGLGVVFFFLFSCYLLLLASSLARRLGLRKHGLPTRKPPGPHRACT